MMTHRNGLESSLRNHVLDSNPSNDDNEEDTPAMGDTAHPIDDV